MQHHRRNGLIGNLMASRKVCDSILHYSLLLPAKETSESRKAKRIENVESITGFDQIGSLLCDSVHSRLQVCRGDQRDDTRVHNAEALHTMHSEIATNASAERLRHHCAATRHVCKGSLESLLLNKVIDDLIIRLRLGAGSELDGGELLELRIRPVFARPSDHSSDDLAIDRVLKGVELYIGVAVFVAWVDGDSATREGALQGADGEAEGYHGELANSGVSATMETSDDVALLGEAA